MTASAPAAGIEVHALAPHALEDYLAFFDGPAFADYPEWADCYCFEAHATSVEDWEERPAEDNRRDVAAAIRRGVHSGFLGYEGEQVVGWCHATIRSAVRELKLPRPDDADEVGAVLCFVIAHTHRGRGIASTLLDAAIERFRGLGLKAVEAYPHKDSTSPQSNYRGPLSLYLSRGFEIVGEHGERHIARLTL